MIFKKYFVEVQLGMQIPSAFPHENSDLLKPCNKLVPIRPIWGTPFLHSMKVGRAHDPADNGHTQQDHPDHENKTGKDASVALEEEAHKGTQKTE